MKSQHVNICKAHTQQSINDGMYPQKKNSTLTMKRQDNFLNK